MMSYAYFPTVGCLLSWESKLRELSLAWRAIVRVKSFHNLDIVMSRRKILRHVTNTFQGLRNYKVSFFKMSSFHYKDALL